MRRRPVASSELARITTLRQQGASWLKIERDTKIPRRAAKRAYEDSERGKSADELKLARTEVARDEFRKHLGQLAKVAERLATGLKPPNWPTEKRPAADWWQQLWSGEDVTGLASDERLVLRHNLMLLDALKSHTEGKVRWNTLEEWRGEWDACVVTLGELSIRTRELLKDIMKQTPETKSRKASGLDEKTIDQMIEGTLAVLWDNLLDGDPRMAQQQVEIRPAGPGKTFVVFGDRAARATITLIDKSKAEKIEGLCKWVLNNLNIEDEGRSLIGRLSAAVTQMREKQQEMEEMLDPLILTPLLLKTRCSLCPV